MCAWALGVLLGIKLVIVSLAMGAGASSMRALEVD